MDFSSLEPAATREMAAELEARTGMRWIDAPVSGGTPGAEAGTLAIMAGGRVEDIERVRPILAHLGQRLTRMGDVGAGQVTKVCNQMIVACNALVIAEVVALAEKAGVDASLIAPALAGGFADSKPLQILAPQMAESRFEPVKWHVRTLLKDLDTAVRLSREQGSSTPMSGLAAQLMRLHGSQGNLERDPATLQREPLRYALSLIGLERQLNKRDDMLDLLGSRLDQIEQQVQHFGLVHENVIASCAALYQDTLSTFRQRIQVHGDMRHLQINSNAARIRALLLAGIRSARLWRQLGGNRWQLVFSRRKLLNELRPLLNS
ncbi:High frequency lysogenization protein HflD [compost metagenome]